MKVLKHLVVPVLFSASFAASAETGVTYTQLVNSVIVKLPEQQAMQGLNELASGYRNASSWLANDVYLNLAVEDDQWTGNQGYQTWEAGAGFGVSWPSQKEASDGLVDNTGSLQQASQRYLTWLAEKQVRNLVWVYKKAEINYQFQKQSYTQTEKLVDTVRQSYEAGEKPKIDWLLAQKSLKKIQQQVQKSEAELDIAQANYQYWTDQTKLPASLMENSPESPVNMADALSNHPYLSMLQARLNLTKAQKSFVDAQQSGNPEIYLGTKSEQDDQTSANQYLIAQVSIPLGFNPANKKQIAEINQQVSEQNIVLYRAKQDLQAAFQKTKRDFEVSASMLLTAQENVNLSAQALKLEEQAYRSGNTHIQNLLLVRQAFFEDQLNAELSKLAVQEAKARLNEVLGVNLP